MKNVLLLFFLLSVFASCSFLGQGKTMASFELWNGNTIILTSIGGGATTGDAIWVSEQNENTKESALIDRIDDFNYDYLTKFNQLNDSLLIISLKDTVKGYREVKFEINLKNRIAPNDGSPGAKRLD